MIVLMIGGGLSIRDGSVLISMQRVPTDNERINHGYIQIRENMAGVKHLFKNNF